MQTVLSHENQVEGLFLAHTQSPEIGTFDIFFCHIRIAPTFRVILILPFISYWKDDITEFYVKNISETIWHSVSRNKAWYIPNEAFCVPKSDKIVKRMGYSDYSCSELFFSNVSFGFDFQWLFMFCRFRFRYVFCWSKFTSVLHPLSWVSACEIRLHWKAILYRIIIRSRLYCFATWRENRQD